jgi:2-polyprenyl-3-methyl-5-hydroxy-6-metoxy-1,4-benzoquinol methylase
MIINTKTTKDIEYAKYLIRNQESFISAIFQWPYRTHLHSLRLSKTLDIGCGAGRNLKALNEDSVGIDHNSLLVESCKAKGLTAYTTEDFLANAARFKSKFNSILISHVAEHMPAPEFISMLIAYKPFLQHGGRMVVVCPQEKGYASDSTHVYFMDFETISDCLKRAGFTISDQYSFPFPRFAGKIFSYNEFIVIGRI